MLKPRLTFPLFGVALVAMMVGFFGASTLAQYAQFACYAGALAIAFVAALRVTRARMTVAASASAIALCALAVQPHALFTTTSSPGWPLAICAIGALVAASVQRRRQIALPDLA